MLDITKESNIVQLPSYLAKTTNSREGKEDKAIELENFTQRERQVSKEVGILSYK